MERNVSATGLKKALPASAVFIGVTCLIYYPAASDPTGSTTPPVGLYDALSLLSGLALYLLVRKLAGPFAPALFAGLASSFFLRHTGFSAPGGLNAARTRFAPSRLLIPLVPALAVAILAGAASPAGAAGLPLDPGLDASKCGGGGLWLVSLAAVFAASRFRTLIRFLLAKPGALYLALMSAALVVLVHSLYRGDLALAESAARALYAFMVIEVVVIVARKALAYRKNAASRNTLTIRIEPRAKRAAKGPPRGGAGVYAKRGVRAVGLAPRMGLSAFEITRLGGKAGGEDPRHGEGPGLRGDESLNDKGRAR